MERRLAREIALHIIFESSFDNEKSDLQTQKYLKNERFENFREDCDIYKEKVITSQIKYIETIISGVLSHSAELDAYIDKYAIGWDFGRISRINTAIIKLSMYELMYMSDIPHAVSINEAVEFAKKYDSDNAASFVNGVLGSFVRKELSI